MSRLYQSYLPFVATLSTQTIFCLLRIQTQSCFSNSTARGIQRCFPNKSFNKRIMTLSLSSRSGFLPVEEIYEKRVTPYGNGAKIDPQKKIYWKKGVCNRFKRLRGFFDYKVVFYFCPRADLSKSFKYYCAMLGDTGRFTGFTWR